MDKNVASIKQNDNVNENDKDDEKKSGKQRTSEKPRIVIKLETNDDETKFNDDSHYDIAKTTTQNSREPGASASGQTKNVKSVDEEGTSSLLTDEEEAKLRKRILVIFIVLNIMGFLGSFSYWMQSGVLPYLTRKLGVYSSVFGYMQSTYAFYQMIGSPIFGR